MRHLRQVGADRLAGDVLAEPDRQRRPAGRRVLEDVAELHDPPARVGDLDADGRLAGDRREDADVGRRQRVGEVVLELGDLAHLDAGREAQLEARDVRAGDGADDLRLDAEVPERLDQARRGLLLAGGVRARLLGGRALEQRDARQLPVELGIVGDRAAQAPLRRQVGRAGRARLHARDDVLGVGFEARERQRLVGAGASEVGPGRLLVGFRRRVRGRRLAVEVGVARRAVQRRRLDVRGGDDDLAVPRVGRLQRRGVELRHLGELGGRGGVGGTWPARRAARAEAGGARARGPGRGRGRRGRARASCRRGPSRSRAARRRPTRRSAAARRRRTGRRRGCARRSSTGRSRRRTAARRRRSRRAARRTARSSSPAASPSGPMPNVPAASASVSAANRHSAPARNGRTAGSTGRRTNSAPAATIVTGTRQRDLPDEVGEAVGRGLPGGAAVPAEVDGKGEEDPDRDEAEADQVEVALLEQRHAHRVDRPRAGTRLGLRLALGAGGCGLAGSGHGRRQLPSTAPRSLLPAQPRRRALLRRRILRRLEDAAVDQLDPVAVRIGDERDQR